MTKPWPFLLVALCGYASAEYSLIHPPVPRLGPVKPVHLETVGEPLHPGQYRTAMQFAPAVVGKTRYVDIPFPVMAGNYNWYVESSPYMDPKLGWFHNANVGFTTINGQVWAVTTNTGRGHLWYRIKGIPK